MRKLLFAALIFTLGCAPQQKNRVFPDGKGSFGPKQTDPILDRSHIAPSQAHDQTNFSWSGQVESAEYLRTAEDLMRLAKLKDDLGLGILGENLMSSFYRSPTVDFSVSPYMEAATGETKADSLAEIAVQSRRLEQQPNLINLVLHQTDLSYAWPVMTTPAHLALAAEGYLEDFLKNLRHSKVDPRVRIAIEDKFKKAVFPEIEFARNDALAVFARPIRSTFSMAFRGCFRNIKSVSNQRPAPRSRRSKRF